MNYEKSILNLRQQKKNKETGIYNMYMKYIPETKDEGVLDPRQLKFTKQNLKNEPIEIKNKRMLSDNELKAIRDSFGCKNYDMSNKVTTNKILINDVPVEIYRKSDIPNNCPVIVNIHGGGFFGGSIDVVRNSCKLLADRSCATVISIDYDLSPKAKFPIALNQCNSVIKYIKENYETLGVNPKKIVVMGDSAGGNIAAALCLLDTENDIALQVLLYPLLDLKLNDSRWSEDLYSFNDCKENNEIAKLLVNDIKNIMEVCIYSYVEEESQLSKALSSPLNSDNYKLFPMTLIVSPEFDYLRLQAEKFAKKLQDNGVDTIIYRYQGMGHAFYEHLGEFPQAEDCINEIAEAIMAL
jgi:acetyl esterase/lipase